MAVIEGNRNDNLLIGTRESDSLSGLGGDDRLYGRRGNDDLDGGFGADLMAGRVGDDVYWVDDLGDRVSELLDEGFFDQVRSSVSYVLTRNVEHLVLIGTADIDGYGNALENILVGNEGDNLLDGRDGLDRLEGRAGNDVYVVGGDGEDFDQVVEHAQEGVDTVRLNDDEVYQLSDNVENVVVIKRSADFSDFGASVRGNDLDNAIYGGAFRDGLEGGGGDDRIRGREGHDTLRGGSGDDRLFGGDGDDALYGNDDGRDYIFGGRGRDTIELRFDDMAEDRLYYDVNPEPENADFILGFSPGEDRFFLDRSVYAGLTSNWRLDRDAFHLGSSAADAEDRIVYNRVDGKLHYDPDGTGGAAMSLIATLTDKPELSHIDFVAYGG